MSVIQDNSITSNNIQPASGQSLTIKDEGGTASITVQTDGDLTLAENVYLGSGKGIYFDGQTTSANFLDDYEEGTWTCAVSGLDSGSITLSDSTGYYQVIGHFVFIIAGLEVGSVSSPSGNMNINLPITPATGDTRKSGLAIYGSGFTGSPHAINGYVHTGVAKMQIREYLNNGGTADLGQHCQAGTLIFLSGSYQI